MQEGGEGRGRDGERFYEARTASGDRFSGSLSNPAGSLPVKFGGIPTKSPRIGSGRCWELRELDLAFLNGGDERSKPSFPR